MKDVADVAGISQAAVSMALRGHPRISETQRVRIRQICDELGYKNLRPGRVRRGSRTLPALTRIGLVTVGTTHASALLHPISLRCQDTGTRLEVLSLPVHETTPPTCDQILEFSRHLDGILLTDWISHEMLSVLHSAGKPYVVLGHIMTEPGSMPRAELVRTVTCDERDMGRFAAHALFKTGHRRLLFLSGSTPAGLYNAHWRDGFRLAHADLGYAPGNELMITADMPEDERCRKAETVFDGPDSPTGFVLVNRVTARYLLEAARRRGKSIQPQNAVMGDFPQQVAAIGLQGCGILAPDFEAIADQALHLLTRQCAGDRNFHGEVTVPFLAFGFDRD